MLNFLYQFSPLKKIKIQLLEKLAIPAPACGRQVCTCLPQAGGNDNLDETTKESFQRAKVLQFFFFFTQFGL
jgi:hypothetical protein